MEKRLSCVCESSNETGGYSLRFVAIEFLFISSVRGNAAGFEENWQERERWGPLVHRGEIARWRGC